jgi:hypothetical protein
MYGSSDPITSVLLEAETNPKVLGSTIRRYRPSYKAALIQAGSLDIETDYAATLAALERRRGRPPEPQGASIKAEDATRDEAEKTFRRLKALVLATGSQSAMAAGLYVLVVPRIGIRPIELLDGEVVGTQLRIKNAKWRPGLAVYRTVSLKRFAPVFIEATKWLCVLAQQGCENGKHATWEERFNAWRNSVAECLARASEATCGRRLALYSFRHSAIATWKAAGFSAADIAEMAGHLSLKSAWKHYAPAKVGWREPVIVEPVRRDANIPPQELPNTEAAMQATSDSPADKAKARRSHLPPSSGTDTSSTAQSASKRVQDDRHPSAAKSGFVVEEFPQPAERRADNRDTVDATGYLSAKGDEAARLAALANERLKQNIYLQPDPPHRKRTS